MTNPDPDYFLDNYGTCAADKCACLKDGWLGRACPNWKPSGATSFEDLSRMLRLPLDNAIHTNIVHGQEAVLGPE